MLPSKFHCSLFAVAAICCLPFIHSTIQWPKAIDEFDQNLINLARFKRQISEDETTETPTTTTSAVVTATDAPKNGTKIQKIDWSEVEANWRKVLSEEDVKAKWEAMEKSTKNGVRAILRQIFPRIVSMSSDAKVSGNCSAGILKWIISLRHLKGWAIKNSAKLDSAIKKVCSQIKSLHIFEKNFKKCSTANRTKGYLEGRLEAIDGLWEKIMQAHEEVQELETEKDAERPYFKDEMFGQVDEKYGTIVGIIKEYLHQFDPQPQPPPNGRSGSVGGGTQSMAKLLKIELPKFDGSYHTWLSFKNLYSELIHNRRDVTNVEKLKYLQSCLTGDAEKVIQRYQITDANYDLAWNRLNEKFDNKRILQFTQVETLLDRKTIKHETAAEVKELLDVVQDCLEALKILLVDVSTWDIVLIVLITRKLPYKTRELWEEELEPSTVPTFQQLCQFMEKRYRTLESLELVGDSKEQEPIKSDRKSQVNNFIRNKSHQHGGYVTTNCVVCEKGNHSIIACERFAIMTVANKSAFVNAKKLCRNCLMAGHVTTECKSQRRCLTCGGKHNTFLHKHNVVSSNQRSTNINNVSPESGSQEQTIGKKAVTTLIPQKISVFSPSCNQVTSTETLFPTFIVKVKAASGVLYTLRGLFDQCSEGAFMKESVAKMLGLKLQAIQEFEVTGIDNTVTSTIQSATEFNVVIDKNKSFDVKAYVVSTLVGMLPRAIVKWPKDIFKNIRLSDPTCATPGNVDIMFGGEIYAKIILSGILKGGGYLAQNTEFGWIVSGFSDESEEVSQPKQKFCLSTRIKSSVETDDDVLKRFWELEEPPQAKKNLTEDEIRCEEIFKKSYRRMEDGRVQVKLPFKQRPEEVLGASRNLAVARWIAMEKKLRKNQGLKIDYMEVMREHFELGHMKRATTREIDHEKMDSNGEMKYSSYYIPHHAVIKEESTTTKTRIVFDASAKTRSNVSLNDILLIGPTIQDSLLVRLMKWRCHRFAIRGDITKMYRQICVYEEDENYQRIVFRFNENDPIEDFILPRLTFGTASAPYSAIKTLKMLAKEEKNNFPIGAAAVESDFQVDDLLTGGETEQQVKEIYRQTTNLLKSAKLPMRKWISNSNEVMKIIPEGEREIKDRDIQIDDNTKTLGIGWSPIADEFFFRIPKVNHEKILTKRVFLSQAAKLFDPLGWLGPTIIKPKIMLQSVWKEGLGWDDKISDSLAEQWISFREKLPHVEEIRIPRWFGFSSSDYKVELHGFCDASIVAYGTVWYVKSTDPDGNVQVNIVLAKSRVAPIQTVRLPRLELCGALLLAELAKTVVEELKIEKFYCWTDSSITLAWINSSPDKYKTFVANRVSEIQSLTNSNDWRHVSSTDNPADCLSRGLDPDELKGHDLWWHGPKWLQQNKEFWPKNANVKIPEDELELKGLKVLTTRVSNELLHMMNKFSSFTALVRATAKIRKFKCKPALRKPLLVRELEKERLFWIKEIQKLAFGVEINALKEAKPLPKKSKLLPLFPFLDSNGILRVGGRLKEASVAFDSKHQILIPKNSDLARLIVSDSHNITKHGGTQLTITYTRTQYWIIDARSVVKQYIKRCVICHRYSKQNEEQLMGNLPEPRVNFTRAFMHTGVDYAGPIKMLVRRRPGKRETTKGYIALFVCLCTKAIHLEVVSDQTTEAYLQAFKRFYSRRGLPSNMYSDNGTTFVGARNELDEEYRLIKDVIEPKMAELILKKKVQWSFIPPNAPHFGGLWEAGVKSMKHHLKRTVKDSAFTFEETTTLVCEIEACLNSRPLCPVSNDPNDLSILTPAHFLIGDNLLAPPRPSLIDIQVNRLGIWNQISQRVEHFAKRWKSEYLSRLQHRGKWMRQCKNVKVGDIVIIKNDDLPPSKWLLGRITEVFPDKEGLVRKVTVKTATTSLKRPIHKIGLLPIDEPVDANHPPNNLQPSQ